MTGMSRLASGKLTTFVRLQEYRDTTTASGNKVRQWVEIDTLFVNVLSLTGAALYYASQQSATINSYLKMRYREDVKIGMRFVTDTHNYVVIKEPTDIDGRHATLQVACQELQAVAP